jgi:hypothetical protein
MKKENLFQVDIVSSIPVQEVIAIKKAVSLVLRQNVASHNVYVTKRNCFETHVLKILRTVTFVRFVTFTFWNYYVLKFLRLETLTFSDVTLSDVNFV